MRCGHCACEGGRARRGTAMEGRADLSRTPARPRSPHLGRAPSPPGRSAPEAAGPPCNGPGPAATPPASRAPHTSLPARQLQAPDTGPPRPLTADHAAPPGQAAISPPARRRLAVHPPAPPPLLPLRPRHARQLPSHHLPAPPRPANGRRLTRGAAPISRRGKRGQAAAEGPGLGGVDPGSSTLKTVMLGKEKR